MKQKYPCQHASIAHVCFSCWTGDCYRIFVIFCQHGRTAKKCWILLIFVPKHNWALQWCLFESSTVHTLLFGVLLGQVISVRIPDYPHERSVHHNWQKETVLILIFTFKITYWQFVDIDLCAHKVSCIVHCNNQLGQSKW